MFFLATFLTWDSVRNPGRRQEEIFASTAELVGYRTDVWGPMAYYFCPKQQSAERVAPDHCGFGLSR